MFSTSSSFFIFNEFENQALHGYPNLEIVGESGFFSDLACF